MDINKYETANSWYSAMRGEEYEVPVTLLQTIEAMMKKEKITFAEAYKRLEDGKNIIIKDKEIIFKPVPPKRY